MLLDLRGKALVCHAVDTALASSLRPIIVVCDEPVRQVLGGRDVSVVLNIDASLGMSRSLAMGIHALPQHCPGVMVMLGDMPAVLPETLESLADAARRHPREEALVPVYHGRRGNPVLLRRALFPQLLKLEGDIGARRMLGEAMEVEVTDGAVLVDIDTAQDFATASLNTGS
jgi:molybdenum cofactor cytidylyltransferase